MKRILKYILCSGGIGLLITTGALLNVMFNWGTTLSLSILICLPGAILVRDWNISASMLQDSIIILIVNTVSCILLGLTLALASRPLDHQHRQRIKRYGIKAAWITGIATAVVFILFLTIGKYSLLILRSENMVLTNTWTGTMQAWYIWGDTFKSTSEAYAYGMIFGVPINAGLGFVVGCLIAAFTSRWAKLPIRQACPKCDYDLTGTPHHCPECGWVAKPDDEPSEGESRD